MDPGCRIPGPWVKEQFRMDRAFPRDARRHATQGKEASMRYDKDQAAAEFTRWSESYDRSVLQWMLFGPTHRVLIRRIAAVAGNRPFRLLDVGCGTGLFAARLKAALPQ